MNEELKEKAKHPIIQLFLVIELARAAIDGDEKLHKEILELMEPNHQNQER